MASPSRRFTFTAGGCIFSTHEKGFRRCPSLSPDPARVCRRQVAERALEKFRRAWKCQRIGHPSGGTLPRRVSIGIRDDVSQGGSDIVCPNHHHRLQERGIVQAVQARQPGPTSKHCGVFSAGRGHELHRRLGGHEFTLGRAPEGHIATLTEKAFLPLKTLFSVDYASPYYNEQSKQGIFYAESWALTHYLILGADGKRRSQFAQFLTALAKGEPVDDSFAEAFQTDYGTIQDELRDYLRKRNTWPTMKVTSRENIQIDVRSIRTTTLSEAESDYYLGDLLLHMNRLGDAETHLKNALTKDPNLVSAQASFGILQVRQRKYDEAVTALKKAVEADSKNHITNYYYAYVLERAETEGTLTSQSDFAARYETIRTYAKKAIELAPRFAEAYALLARINMYAGENLDESEAMLKKAITAAPGRHDLQLLLAETYLRADKTAD